MSANSSFFNVSFLGQQFSTVNVSRCFITSPFVYIIGTFCVTNILFLLPLWIFIICFGFRQLQLKTSTTSHCDSFTYHMVAMEVIGSLGRIVSFFGSCLKKENLLFIGLNVSSLPWYGKFFFHTLTCIESYLAVVHPITYLTLKQGNWIRIRNVTISFAWLLSIVGDTIVSVTNIIYFDVFLLVSSTTIVFFCCVTVLYALIRPGPGDRSGDSERVDQSKQRAFYTITIILLVLMLKLSFSMISASMEMVGDWNECTMSSCSMWFNLPSCLVLPLLFLLRKKLVCFKK